MLKLNKLYILFVTVLSWGVSFAQDNTGSGISTSFVQEVELEIQLDSAERVYEGATFPVPRKVEVEKQTYQAQDFSLRLSPLDQKIKVFTVKSEELTPLEKHYIRAGFGNYVTPYLDIFTGSGRNEKFIYSANFKHLSSKKGPVNKKASGNSQNLFDFSTKYNVNETSFITGSVNYERLAFNYYGINLLPEDSTLIIADDYSTKQALKFLTTKIGYQNQLTDELSLGIDGSFLLATDKLDARERQFSLGANGKYNLNDNSFLRLDVESFFTKRSDSSSITRNYVGIKPMYYYKKGSLTVNGGAKVVYENDTLSERSKVHVYPQLHLEVKLIDQLSAYVGLSGDMIRNTYSSLVRENRFLGSDFRVLNTNKAIEFYGGIKGNVSDKISYNSRLSYQNYKYFNVFLNDITAPMEFLVGYDEDNTTIVNFNTELKYTKPDKFGVGVVVDLNSYTMSNFDYAYHRPVLQSKLFSEYKINKNLTVNTDIFYISGIKSMDVLTLESIKLNPIIDLNLGVEYSFNKKLSTFLQLNNLLSKDYQFYQYYPVRGFNLLLGATYSF